MRGLKKVYEYGEERNVSITDLLKKPEVVNYLGNGRELTYASQRNRLRRRLAKFGESLKETVDRYNLENPPGERRQRDVLYGSQRVRAGLGRKVREGSIEVDGEKLTVRQTLEKYPRLRGFLRGDREISERSLESKLRVWMKKGKVPVEVFDLEPRIVRKGGSWVVTSSGNMWYVRTRNAIVTFLEERPQNKVQFTLTCVMVKVDPATGDVIAEEEAYFHSSIEVIYESTNLDEVYERMTTKILESFSTYLKNGSGWALKRVVGLEISLIRFWPLRGSSHIPLPKTIGNRKAVINMRNEDHQCFKWAVTRALNPVERDAERITRDLREKVEELVWDGIIFPTPCSERFFEKFGGNNDVSVLVFGYDGERVIPLFVPRIMRGRVVRLFFQKSDDGTKSHYGVVKSMSRLVSSQVRSRRNRKYVCDYCLNAFPSDESLGKHLEYCSKHDAVNVKMPVPGRNTLKFKNVQNMVECPVKIMFDFESFLVESDKVSGKMKLYQRHKPSAFCLYVVSRVEGFSMDPITYVCQNENEDVADVFVRELEKVTKKIYETFKDQRKMVFDEEAKRLHDSQDRCYACEGKFGKGELSKVRDHCHYTGKYRGALHSKCNLKMRRSRFIPVFAHNLGGYDSHLFVKRLADTQGDVNCIPRNEEKYITFTKAVHVDVIEKGEDNRTVDVYSNLRFVDTINFMQASLEKLVGNMERPDFKHTSKYFNGEKLDLMLQKGVYPYEYMDGVKKF